MNNLQYHIESFCREHGIEAPMFWNLRQDDNDLYAVSLHLHANDRWEEFDARAVFVLYNCSDRDSKEAEKTLLLQMFKELGEPLVLTIKDSVSPSKQRFFKEFGMTMAPVRWSDNDNTLRHISMSKSRGWNPSLERVKKSPTMLFIELSAEREGFEPPVPLSTAVFKTAVIDHSTISPRVVLLKADAKLRRKKKNEEKEKKKLLSCGFFLTFFRVCAIHSSLFILHSSFFFVPLHP